jgi:hypothetical protein
VSRNSSAIFSESLSALLLLQLSNSQRALGTTLELNECIMGFKPNQAATQTDLFRIPFNDIVDQATRIKNELKTCTEADSFQEVVTARVTDVAGRSVALVRFTSNVL